MDMRRLTLSIFVCLIGLLLTAPLVFAGPKAVIASSVHEFDAVPDGTEVKHDFILQNKGDAPLKIERVRTG